jgi:hypothetical protein
MLLGIVERTILKTYQGHRVGGCRLDSSGLGQELLTGCCEHGNELLVSIRMGSFFTT